MSTFSPVSSWSSNGMSVCECKCVCVCVCEWVSESVCACVCMDWTWSMHYAGISTYQFIPYYVSAIHRHTHTRIHKPFEGSLPTGLKVDSSQNIAKNNNNNLFKLKREQVQAHSNLSDTESLLNCHQFTGLQNIEYISERPVCRKSMKTADYRRAASP